MTKRQLLFIFITAAISIAALLMSIRNNRKIDNGLDAIDRYEQQARIHDSVDAVLADSIKALHTRIAKQDLVVARHSDTLKQITKKYEKVRSAYIALPVNNRVELFTNWLSEIDSNTGR